GRTRALQMKLVPPVTNTLTDKPYPGPMDQSQNGAGLTNRRARQRALAIGIVDGEEDGGDSLAELKELLRTAGVATAGEMVQRRAQPDPDRYFGKGKMAELKAASASTGDSGAD